MNPLHRALTADYTDDLHAALSDARAAMFAIIRRGRTPTTQAALLDAIEGVAYVLWTWTPLLTPDDADLTPSERVVIAAAVDWDRRRYDARPVEELTR